MNKTVKDIRSYFIDELNNERFTTDKTGAKTIEIIGASFIADEAAIFGTPNQDYIDAELKWYKTQSTNISTLGSIYGKEPAAWAYAANDHGEINSNYGTLIYSEKYYNQYNKALVELIQNKDTRRAIMIYNRPSIWTEYNENYKSDFICTNAVTYYVRGDKIHAVVQMRSNDAWAGYRNDYAWAKHVLDEVVKDYNLYSDDTLVTAGDIHWQVQNLHVYAKNFYIVDHAIKTGEVHITKDEYRVLYPDSPWI